MNSSAWSWPWNIWYGETVSRAQQLSLLRHPFESKILVWMQMILRHRLMRRDQDILFQENLDPLVREKLLYALASGASQASLLCSKLTSYRKNPRLILTFEGIFNPCLAGPPWICFTKYCLCLLPCIWERKVQCLLSLSISPKASVSVDSTVKTVGGAASLWFGFWCLRSRLTLLGGLELSWKTQNLWLELTDFSESMSFFSLLYDIII